MPRMPPEKEPAPWQRAGIEAALSDPAPMVQFHALYYCKIKKWVAQLHLPTAQWLKWLAVPDWEIQAQAAKAAVQLGAQTPPEVQRELLRMLKDKSVDFSAQFQCREALYSLAGNMIPEAQLEMALFIQHRDPNFGLTMNAYESLGALGPAMTPATQEVLLSFIQNPQADDVGVMFAKDALANVGAGMQPQMRQKMLDLLLDAGTPPTLRSFAARALGSLGAELPPQALEYLLSVLRDPADKDDLRSSAAHALVRLGPHMPPEVQQALLAAYDEMPPKNADEAARKSHHTFHQSMADALEQAGPEMPAAFQQRLVAGYLKRAHAARDEPPHAPVKGDDGKEPRVDLSLLAGVRPQPDSAVIRALLAEFQDPRATLGTLSIIAEQFFQPLADRGALPPDVQQALLTCLQDEKEDEFARRLAAETLGRLGASTTPAVQQALLALLKQQQALSEPQSLYYSTVQAMLSLGTHMPPEAAPALVDILRRNTWVRKDPFAATYSLDADEPKDPWSRIDGIYLQAAMHALGNLGEKMPPEVQAALLRVIEYQPGNYQTPWSAAYALAQMGDKLPPQTQQRLLALLFTSKVGMEYELDLACRQALGVSGIHPVSDKQVADLLAWTQVVGPYPEHRFYLYLWLGRTPAHLQAVRWLGRTDTEPPLGDTPPQEVLGLVSRLWPHSAGGDAGHAALRQAMARRTSQMMTPLLKAGVLDEPTRKVLAALAAQLAEDTTADCATALREVQAALAADAKGR